VPHLRDSLIAGKVGMPPRMPSAKAANQTFDVLYKIILRKHP
jgi:hypothetical protein